MGTEKTNNIAPKSQRISHFFSVFEDFDKEACFRQEILPKQRSLVFKLCAVLAITMPIFLLTDYMIVKPEPWSSFLIGQRVAQLTSCIIFLFFIIRVRSYVPYDILVFSTLLIFFILLELG